MDEKYSCPRCGQHVIIPDAPPGAALDCPNCKQAFRLEYQAGVRSRLASPGIWCIGAVLAICVTAPFFHKWLTQTGAAGKIVPNSVPVEKKAQSSADPILSGKALSAWLEDMSSPSGATSRHARDVLRNNATAIKPLLVKSIQNQSESSRLRREAPEALGLMIANGDPEIQVLFKALRNKDRHVVANAMKALRQQDLDEKRLVPILLEMSKDANGGIRRTAAQFLGDFAASNPEAMAALQTLANDPDPIVKDGASRTTIRKSPTNLLFKDEKLTAAVRDLQNGDTATRKSARDRLRALGRAAVPDLIAAMENREATSRDRALAAQVLGYTGKNQEPEVPALINATKDNDETVREYATASLGLLDLDPVSFVPMCIDLISDKSSRVRRRAAENLAHIGPPAKDAIPSLKRLAVKDGAAATRSAAKLALQKISPSEAISGTDK